MFEVALLPAIERRKKRRENVLNILTDNPLLKEKGGKHSLWMEPAYVSHVIDI